MTKIGDLVEIPEIKTVIQLKDLQESNLRQMILSSFVVTAEVVKSLEMVLTSLSGGEGRGTFLKGHFGSGKSHFLSMLSLLLRYPESWDNLIGQEPSLKRFQENLQPRRFLVVEVSLIQHRGTEFLEDIFLKEIFCEISAQMGRPFEGADSRHDTFQEIRRAMRTLGFSGLVLLVDELSEFLRSKTDAHAYHEDIRFLQYLEEEASSFPLWIIASLQEWIEETGEINQDLFNKIKDRYPVRISLGRSHIEEIVSHRLISHRQGAEEEIRKVFHALRRYSQEKFLQEFIPALLSRRFSKHHRIHPYMEALAPTTIPSLLRDLYSTGMLEVDDRSKFGLRTILDELLKPMGLVKKKGNQYLLHADPRGNELVEYFLSLLEKGPLSPETLYWSIRKSDFGLLKHQFEVLLFALLFSGNILAYQGQRKKGLEDISRSGLQGITTLGKGEILGEEIHKIIPLHPLLPEKLRKVALTLPSQESLWNDIRSRKKAESEFLQNLLHRLNWASSFQAFRNLPWDSFRRDTEDVLAQWEEVKGSFPPKEGLERFLSAAAKEPFLPEKLERLAELRSFFGYAERVLFVYQYITDPRLSVPDQPVFQSLREERNGLLLFFEAGNISIDVEEIQGLLDRFQKLRESYSRAYAEAHQKDRSGEQFASYERLRQSKRYLLLTRLDELEMVSVKHNRSSVDRIFTTVLSAQCRAPTLLSLSRAVPSAAADTSSERRQRLRRAVRSKKPLILGLWKQSRLLSPLPIRKNSLPI